MLDRPDAEQSPQKPLEQFGRDLTELAFVFATIPAQTGWPPPLASSPRRHPGWRNSHVHSSPWNARSPCLQPD